MPGDALSHRDLLAVSVCTRPHSDIEEVKLTSYSISAETPRADETAGGLGSEQAVLLSLANLRVSVLGRWEFNQGRDYGASVSVF